MARKEKNPMISPDEAIALVRAHTFLLDEETVPLLESAGRFLAKDVVSDVQIPPFDNSAMDGFALSHLLLRDASKEHPVTLPIAGEAKAGAAHAEAPDRSAFRIMTGAMVPLGADTVVPIEETSESNRFVTFDHPAAPGDNIRRAGEDIPQGMTVLRQGDRITSAVMGLLASLNMTHIPVFRKARVGIIATGDEIDEPGATLAEGHIRNSNAYSLYAEVLKYGGEPHYVGIAKDTREEIAQMLTKALEYDIIITSGGISMGEYDFVPEVLREHHVRLIFETVKMKPGKPCIFGVMESFKEKKLFFGLPGNPVSSLVSFIQFVRPALLSLMGATKLRKPEIAAIALEKISKKKGRTHYIRGFFSVENGKMFVTTTGPQGSGILRSMHEANCLIVLPADCETVNAGDAVTIQLIHHEEIA